MSNLSLKEQLQAFASDLPAPVEAKKVQPVKIKPQNNISSAKAANPAKATRKEAAPRPAWLEQARYGVELLKVHYPACFKEPNEIVPLKIGIRQDLIKHLGGRTDIALADKACMSSSLSYYVNSPGYHRRVISGVTRIDLNGEAAGLVTEEEAVYSQTKREAKQQKKQTNVK